MKSFARRQHAVQAQATEKSSGNYGGETKMHRRNANDTNRRPASAPRRHSKSKPMLSLSSPKIGSQTDVWSDDFVPESPPPLPINSFDDPFNGGSITPEEFKIGQLGKAVNAKSLKTYSKKAQRNTITNVPAENLEFLKSRNTSTSTIFQDPQHPITIVLTTPEDEIPEPTYFDTPTKSTTRPRNFSVTSLPIMPSETRQPNPSYLMPPTDNQLDPRKLRQAQEFREIRKWLISFMNAKADQFPRKLRGRMMEIYSIKDTDLDPEILARLNAEDDEGVALEKDGVEIDQKESLRILGQAMRSRIEEITPMPKPMPKPLPRPKSRPQSIKSSPPRNQLVTIPDDEELPPTWLAPLISTSTSSRDSILADDRYLKKAYSAPNLHGKPRPVLPSTQSAEMAPTLRSRGGSVVGNEEMKMRMRAKRGSFLGGAFGAMKEAFGGKPSKSR